jgi:xylosyl alpha-1,3-xylosyltransferase
MFNRAVKSVVKHSTVALHFHVACDDASKPHVERAITGKNYRNVQLTTYDVKALAEMVQEYIAGLREFFAASKDAYYAQTIFYLAAVMHHIMPPTIERMIAIDSDLVFVDDVGKLVPFFDQFGPNTIMALANDQQPVYFHNTWKWRSQNPNTRVGAPPPNGLTGFNSGVTLLHLQHMRTNEVYKRTLEGAYLKELIEKYSFHGHLGDQDLYTLLSFEHEEMFLRLPCSWNRQLCTWWYEHGYEERKKDYWSCEGPIHVWHGNGGYKIPDDIVKTIEDV